MEVLKFQTNIKCSACLAKVTAALNETVGENNWEVDLENPQKTLTVRGDNSANEIIAAIKEVGFEAGRL